MEELPVLWKRPLRNAPSVWLSHSNDRPVFASDGSPAGWAPLVAASQSGIEIPEGSPEWEAAYARWLSGKHPTDDKLWREGVFLTLDKVV